MSVYKHPTKPGWQMIKIFHGRTGKPDYISFHGDREAALIYERELRGIANYTDPGFSDHLPEFRIAYRNRSKPRSLESLDTSIRHLTAFFSGRKMKHLTPSLVEQYKVWRLEEGVKKRTVNVELSALSSYVGWLNETYGTEFKKPKLFTKKETRPPLPQVLTMAEVATILSHLDGDMLTLVELLALSGLRRNEALVLTASDIDLDGGGVRIYGKGGKWRVVPIVSPATIARLRELCRERPTGWLFPSPKDSSKHRVDIRKPIRRAAKAAGITKHINPHLFRHSFGAGLVNSGADIRIIQELLGHSELATTQIYTQVAGVAKRQAIASLVAIVATPENSRQQKKAADDR